MDRILDGLRRLTDEDRQRELDRRKYGVSFEGPDGQRIDPENVKAAKGTVRVEFDRERLEQEKQRIRSLYLNDPLRPC